MSENDFWSRWLRRRMAAFNRQWMLGDVDDVFGEMEELMSTRFRELAERAPTNLVREQVLPSGAKVKEWGPFVYGYSMTVGPDGKPQIQEFGNVRPISESGRPQLDVEEKREPLADVISADGEIKLIIELPGVAKKDIKLRGTEDNMTVSVDTEERKYYKKLMMPVKVDPKSAKSKYLNGVLEVTIKKMEEGEPEGEEMEIE
ncbi:MAG: Hsp20/alpha crystallin family protein [Candidatus Bathyarchaeota archaeon]